MLSGTNSCKVTISPLAGVAIFVITYWECIVLSILGYAIGRYAK
jgi:type IV secretory pathway VirB6-like protein